MTASPDLAVSPEVAAALATGRPVVALESTIVAHGMPWPRNLETAKALESEVRAAGAVPATIAVLDGALRVGLDAGALERLATDKSVSKASRRDLSALVARRESGATTVAATMAIAAMAGIRVFATGGIGGVHRGAETTMDVSADLYELGRTPVAVVCAGAKSILDIPKTLELLESLGVPVLGFRTDDFPAFYARGSGRRVDRRCESAAEIAGLLAAQFRLGLGGVLVANPIPAEHALDADDIERTIAEAVRSAEAAGIGGHALTPYLLGRLNEVTKGASLAANIALACNNARLAGEIAAELSRA
ncbi:MAG: pseudouridine-5'-phosphate glycosidase [Rhodospirillales bacterium]|nr:pseudouridine-5'-phosphate glycosidase [Rhodospirillales bacterium]